MAKLEAIRSGANRKITYQKFLEIVNNSPQKLQLPSLKLSGMTISYLCLDGARMKNCDFTNCQMVEASFESAQLQHCTFVDVNLKCANLRNANISHSNFYNAHLLSADLMRCIAKQCNFTKARLVKADLKDGDFQGSDFTEASLLEANLERASFLQAKINSRYLFVGAINGVLKIFDTTTNTSAVTISNHQKKITFIFFSQKGH